MEAGLEGLVGLIGGRTPADRVTNLSGQHTWFQQFRRGLSRTGPTEPYRLARTRAQKDPGTKQAFTAVKRSEGGVVKWQWASED
ncbi:hypothetical protein ACFS5L_05830 [Streptomyces phyllanthi]|uniref:Uncharacterized protein n=1 Tax=Streptomyces phyllanthi TaxID=1803180 RepID=A0A5N8VYF8_9ACTN|nr:hypothetical protein [Streptomyces phyllanthi]MPY39134.1 hypothetical protein [Streptomyces phyllanthi]